MYKFKNLLLIFCLVLVIFSSGCTNKPKVIDLANGEWAPYTSESLKEQGVVSHIVRDVFESQGVIVNYVFLDWNSGMANASSGKLDGTFPWLKNEDRQKDFCFSEPIAYERVVFFYKKSLDFNWESIDDLKEYSIGGTESYFYNEAFDLAEKDGSLIITRFKDDKTNLDNFMDGQVDIMIGEINVVSDLLHKNYEFDKIDLIDYHEKSISNSDLYLLISRKNKDCNFLIDLFNEGLKNIHESGKLNEYWLNSQNGLYKLD